MLDVLFPPQCAGCNALGSALCDACVPANPPIGIRLPTLRVTARAAYRDATRAAILALKDGRRDVAAALGLLIAPLLGPDSLLVPVPTTAKRRRVRGVDGVALLTRHAAAIAGLCCVSALEQRAGDAQRGRSRSERLAATGRFICDARAVSARRVTLVDDVCTTGATLRDCAAAVREAGGNVESAVVVAVATNSRGPWRI